MAIKQSVRKSRMFEPYTYYPQCRFSHALEALRIYDLRATTQGICNVKSS
jgi:hypothetical protein